ncbi:hypothetical protein [Leptospira santarosai]|uniref:Uncharacterized protein n=1 Tax=Leptospira santarosai serovar Arenal str. MAVJ 401 TaxID=1049976 RepID=M6JGT2_9LEPT|nr:hypothetical protein [Leptospira santarosai]EMN21119.1 hypothetical protein LEP1GSC063_1229 [Leptospira santarosai serovar Arenal str. MAVJ 401]
MQITSIFKSKLILLIATFLFVTPIFSNPKIGNLSGRVLYLSIYDGRDQLITRTKLNPGERVTLGACDQFVVYGDSEPPTNMIKFSSCDREVIINENLKGERRN